MKKNSLLFVLSGDPIAKERSRKAKYVSNWYNPQKDIMNRKQLEIKNQLPDGFKPIDKTIPVTANISWFFSPAKNQMTKKFLETIKNDDYPYLKKKDLDNVQKFVLDILSKIVFYDDAQVYSGIIEKFYSTNPRTEIEILWD